MARTVLEHHEDRLTFPADSILELKIDEAKVSEQNRRDGTGTWEKLSIKFKILGVQAVGDGSNPAGYDNWITEYIYGSIPFYLSDSADNKLRIWLEAIFRTELGLGFEFDTNMIVGRTCRGITSLYQSKAMDNGVPRMRHQIESLLSTGGVPQPVATGPAVDPWGAPQPDPWAPHPQQYQQPPQQQQYNGNGWGQPPQGQQPPVAPPQAPPQAAQPQQQQLPIPAQDPWGTWPKDEEPPF